MYFHDARFRRVPGNFMPIWRILCRFGIPADLPEAAFAKKVCDLLIKSPIRDPESERCWIAEDVIGNMRFVAEVSRGYLYINLMQDPRKSSSSGKVADRRVITEISYRFQELLCLNRKQFERRIYMGLKDLQDVQAV